MPRPRQRVCLQDRLKLELNQLARRGFVQTGANMGGRGATDNSVVGSVTSCARLETAPHRCFGNLRAQIALQSANLPKPKWMRWAHVQSPRRSIRSV
jgi:hypothetical protein